MGRAKMTVTVDEALIEDLDRISESLHRNKSRLVEEALRYWSRRHLERELMEGYRAMAAEDLKTAEDNLAAAYEVLR